MKDKAHIYERCAGCGKVWNISLFAQLASGWYICPVCTKKAGGK